MAISDSQKVDLLYKKYFGVTKTDLATNKSPSNESTASPALVRGDIVWAQSSSIPNVAATTANIVQAYQTTSRIQCTADATSQPISGVYPSWSTGLADWIPPQFGSTYFIKVYAETSGNTDPTTGTPLSDAGSGGTGEWNFDYQAGVLNFIGGTIPAALTSSKVIYITGYRYIGAKGLGTAASANIGNLTFNGNTISVSTSNSNLNLAGSGTGLVVINSTLSGSTLNAAQIGNTGTTLTGTISTNSQPNITGIGTITSGTWNANTLAIAYGGTNTTSFTGLSGNVAGLVYFDGTKLTDDSTVTDAGYNATTNTLVANNMSFTGTMTGNVINAATIGNTGASFTGASISAATIGNTGTILTGTLSTNAQPNITSLGTLTSLALSGTLSAPTVNAANIGNVGSVITGATVNASTIGNAGATLTGSVVNAATIGNAGAVFSGASGTVTGTFAANTINAATIGNTGATLIGTISTASQPNITSLSGVTSIGASNSTTITGTLSTNSQPNVTSLGTLTGLTLSGTLVGTTITAATIGNTGTAHIGATVSAATIGNLGATLTGTLSTNIQPNVTSVGTLSNVTVASAGFAQIANVNISNAGIVSTGTNSNLSISANGSGIVSVTGTTAISIPYGNTAQAPASPPMGSLRYNTDISSIEFFDGSNWIAGTQTVTGQSIIPDGTSSTYTLDKPSSSYGIILTLNGVLQYPQVSYTVSGTQLTFRETPLVTDIVSIRYITTGAQSGTLASVTAGTPTSSTAPGTKGTVMYDSTYIYVCVSTNSWIRAAISGTF